jgi:hypothetical protein
MAATTHDVARHLRRRVRYAFAAMVVAAALLANVAGAQAMGPAQTDAVTTVNTEYWDLKAYWGANAPGVKWFNYSGVEWSTPCGSTALQHNTEGFYCSSVIYLDWSQQNANVAAYGDGSVGFWLAHEYAHHGEVITGTKRAGVNNELLADCYAGSFFRWNHDRGRIFWADYLEARNSIWGLSAYDPTHGTKQQRLESFDRGFNWNNWNTCANTYR